MISEKLYNSDWVDSDELHKKKIYVAQTILQVKPIKIKIARIFFVNFEAFIKLINATYTLITFLKTFKK